MFKAIAITLLICSPVSASVLTSQLLVDQLLMKQNSPPPLQTEASFMIGPGLSDPSNVVWSIGQFTAADIGTTITLNSSTAASYAVDWNQLNSFIQHPSTIIDTITAGPLLAQSIWQYPLSIWGSPIHNQLVDVQFTLTNFVTSLDQGKYTSYLSGTYTMHIDNVPEPAGLWLFVVWLVIMLGVRR